MDAPFKTDLPVMLPPSAAPTREPILPRLKFWHIVPLVALCLLASPLAFAADGDERLSPLIVLTNWMPLLLKGFVFNLVISVSAMAVGTVVGAALGLGQISPVRSVRSVSWFVTQFFRNAPWLVLLFFAMFLLPFQISIFGLAIPMPDWFKAIIGLSLPVMANVSEIVRGAVKSLPSGQWEAAESLAFTRQQTLWRIILPQCFKRMIPPWMNWYAILTMATPLVSILGVEEILNLSRQAIEAEDNHPGLLVPFYGFVMLVFFCYCYPIARATVVLERRFAVKL